MTKLQMISLALLCVMVFLGAVIITAKIVLTELDTGEVTAKPKPQIVETEDGEKVIIKRIGTSSIKKLELEKGDIYFADGWAVYVAD